MDSLMIVGNDDFTALRRLAFAIYDLNGDDHVGVVDVIAFDSYFCQGQTTDEAKCFSEDI